MARDPAKPRRRIPWLVLNVAACLIWLAVPRIQRSISAESCIANLTQITGATMIYSMDHDDRLPPASTWADATLPYTIGRTAYACPDIDGSQADQFGHAFSTALSLRAIKSVADPSSQVLFFDSSDLRWNANGDPAKAVSGGRWNVATLDGNFRRGLP